MTSYYLGRTGITADSSAAVKNIGELTLTTRWDKTEHVIFSAFIVYDLFTFCSNITIWCDVYFLKKHQHSWVFCGKAILCKAEVKHRMWRNGKTLFNHTLLTHQDEPQMSSYRHILLQTLFVYRTDQTTSLCR